MNDDTDDYIKIKKSLEYSGLSGDGTTETVEHEIKKQGEALPAFMAPIDTSLIAHMASSLIQLVASSLVKGTFGKGINEKQEGGFLTFLAAPLLLKGIFGKWLTWTGKRVMMCHNMHKNSVPSFKQ